MNEGRRIWSQPSLRCPSSSGPRNQWSCGYRSLTEPQTLNPVSPPLSSGAETLPTPLNKNREDCCLYFQDAGWSRWRRWREEDQTGEADCWTPLPLEDPSAPVKTGFWSEGRSKPVMSRKAPNGAGSQQNTSPLAYLLYERVPWTCTHTSNPHKQD